MADEKTFGIEETKDLLDWGFVTFNAIGKATADGKVTLTDFPYFVPAISKAASAFGGIQAVAAEMLDLDDEESAELLEFARQRFDLENDRLEELIIETLDATLTLYKLALKWSKYKK